MGAGLAVLLALLIRPRYPDLKVYAFATPAGLLSREAARVTEDFVLTVGLGDDLVMRLSVDSIENFRTSLLITLQACRLPKVIFTIDLIVKIILYYAMKNFLYGNSFFKTMAEKY